MRGSVQFLDRKPEGLLVAERGGAEEPIPF
jgi:hypothetical protein